MEGGDQPVTWEQVQAWGRENPVDLTILFFLAALLIGNEFDAVGYYRNISVDGKIGLALLVACLFSLYIVNRAQKRILSSIKSKKKK